MTAPEALAFIEKHGIVLVSAKGPVPRLTEALAGEPIKGSWWAHPQGRRIFSILSAVSESDEVLVCRLVDGKITLVHHRLWPALVRVADSLPRERLARIAEVHRADGRHVVEESPFPAWVPQRVAERAGKLDIADAHDMLRALGEFSA